MLIRVLSFFVQAVPFEFSLFGFSCLFVFLCPRVGVLFLSRDWPLQVSGYINRASLFLDLPLRMNCLACGFGEVLLLWCCDLEPLICPMSHSSVDH